MAQEAHRELVESAVERVRQQYQVALGQAADLWNHDVEYLTVENVLMIHRAETGLTDPIMDFVLLESATTPSSAGTAHRRDRQLTFWVAPRRAARATRPVRPCRRAHPTHRGKGEFSTHD